LIRFLLARLYLDSLVGKKSPKAIRIALKELSAGSKSYDSAYSNAMERIEGQVPDQREMAKDILSWITCATRQLTTVELQNALAVELGSCEFDQENLPELDDMVSACAGLVTIDDHSGRIRLVHYTAQEYFLRTWTKWFPKAHYDIAASCVTYLSFDCFKEGPCSTDEEFEARRDRYPLYSYVAQNWGYHAQFQTISTEMVLGLLDDMWKLDACVQAMLAQKKSPGHIMYSQRIPNTLRGLHLAAYLGLEDVVRQLIQRGDQINIRDSFGGTPLTWAARNGREAAVQLLLENGADPSGRDKYGRTPLAWAASTGHEGVVKLLLEEDINPEAEDNDGQTPLVWAASTGHEGVVSLLLEKGADPYSKDNRGLTPLVGAAIGGFAGVVKVLLGKGVDLEQRDEDGKTMTSWAVLAGSDSVVELLLEAGADIESKDHDGRTLLSLAAFDYRGRATKLLLEKGADPESRDNNGRTPLSWAASHHHKIVVKLLLDHGVNPDSKDNEGRTPLSWAAASCISEGVVRLLLEKGADPGSQDKDGRTPMSWAASKGHGAVTKILKAYESKKCFRYQK
jgi:ankyrin repeat protein